MRSCVSSDFDAATTRWVLSVMDSRRPQLSAGEEPYLCDVFADAARLQRLLRKDPERRISWPELLKHPFWDAAPAPDPAPAPLPPEPPDAVSRTERTATTSGPSSIGR